MDLQLFMPFYGDIEHFRRAVLSVIGQKDPNWTLTILDDLYPSEIPAEFISSLKDSRITYIRNNSNLGVSGNFQKCIDLAQAQFITIMGCDDLLLENYVGRTRQIIEANPTVSYIQPGVVVIDENDNTYLPLGDKVKLRLRKSFSPPVVAGGENLAASLLKGCWTYFPSIAWNTAEIRKFSFRQNFRIVLDLALQLEIIASGGKLFVDDTDTFAYRRHRTSVSMQSALNGSRFEEENSLFSEFAKTASSMGWEKASRASQLHLTSRLNALVELPSALISRQFKGAGILFKHVLGK
jgi:glycosyltransferase involved in cell wall biosynthesis